MWAKVAEELQVPWRAAEAMHWQLGEAEMAERAGTTPFSQSMSSGSERISPNHGHAHSQPQERLPGISSLHLPPLPNQPPDYGYEPDFDCATTYGLALGGNPGQLGGGSFSLPMPGISTPAYSNGDSSNRGRGAPPLLPSHLSAHHPHQQWGQYRGR